jgi:hypothetical protein
MLDWYRFDLTYGQVKNTWKSFLKGWEKIQQKKVISGWDKIIANVDAVWLVKPPTPQPMKHKL